LSKGAYIRSDIRSVQDFKAQFVDAPDAIRVGKIERAQVLRPSRTDRFPGRRFHVRSTNEPA